MFGGTCVPGMFKEEPQGLPVDTITPRMINTTKAPFYLPLYLVASSTHPLPTLCSRASLSWREPLREAVVQQRTKDFWQKSGKQIVNRGEGSHNWDFGNNFLETEKQSFHMYWDLKVKKHIFWSSIKRCNCLKLEYSCQWVIKRVLWNIWPVWRYPFTLRHYQHYARTTIFIH